jgi:hypothetical protein
LNTEENGTQYYYQWSEKELDIMNNNITYYQEMCQYYQQMWTTTQIKKNNGPEDLQWPKKPINPNKKTMKTKLSISDFNNYLKTKLIKLEDPNCSTVDDCNSKNIEEILGSLQKGYKLIKCQNAITLECNIEYGRWLNKAYKLHQKAYKLHKSEKKSPIPWNSWLKINVGMCSSYERKLRQLASIVKGYPVFRRLGMSFLEVYQLRAEICQLQICRPGLTLPGFLV